MVDSGVPVEGKMNLDLVEDGVSIYYGTGTHFHRVTLVLPGKNFIVTK